MLSAGRKASRCCTPYVYFWRWATWTVFEHRTDQERDVVCFISVARFLDGLASPGCGERLRVQAGAIWVIGCSPEGHQPPANTRGFEVVHQPVCIVLARAIPLHPAGRRAVGRVPALDGLFTWSGSGTMPGRGSSCRTSRPCGNVWGRLISAKLEEKPDLMSEHMRDRQVDTRFKDTCPATGSGDVDRLGDRLLPGTGADRLSVVRPAVDHPESA